jgi:hypothetical protein
MLLLFPKSWNNWVASPTVTFLESAHPHAKTNHLLSQFIPSVEQSHTKVRSPLTLLYYEFTPKKIHSRQLDSTILLMAQLANLSQELHVHIAFASLFHHSAMLLHLPLHVLEWIGFTINHVSPKQEKHPCPSNLFTLQSAYLHNPPNKRKSSTHLLSSSHLNVIQHLWWV